MSALPKKNHREMTEEEYLAFERASQFKHEYRNGEVVDMTGASERHNLISGSTYVALYSQLRGRPCKVYTNDMRVKVRQARLYTYPDIAAVCGDARFSDDTFDMLINPTIIIEVLSPSTETYDRGEKFQNYRKLVSLQEYVLISQVSPHIERFTRQDNDQWLLTEAKGLDAVIELTSIGCTLKLAEVYEQIDFSDTAP
ncbi:MAG: Uma2 family endonuclease [Anaerolineae bacterium]|nr:Uma2 family endonuclease [Anaerolineae bacterium]